MDYNVLRAMEETARQGSIRRASDILGVAPSSVSRSIAILEREMGTALFDRSAGGVELTHAGRLVADYARAVLLDFDTLRADLDDMRGTQRRLLKLTLVESVASHGPVAAASKLLERFRTVLFDVRVMPAPRVVEAVRESRCDIGIGFCAEPDPELLALASVPEPIVLAIRPDHALTNVTGVELSALAGLALAVPGFEFGVRRILDRASATAGVALTTVLTSNDFEILRGFARSGAGAAILPQRAILQDRARGQLKIVPLAGTAFRDTTIDIVVLRKRRLPRIVRAFADVLIQEIRASG
ncbi:MAG TPA: LysR family transcriptional regulator [Rhizomicrobium sp.]|nr:LysR family transcriptional regulator [Rhizomicrobium sp.]